ncbi:MAG: GTPase, partial [Actinomycetota bacterium]
MAKKKELPEIEELISESQQVAAEFDSEIFIPDSFQSTQQDLSDRQALRRVIGLSTELSDISEAEYRQLRLEQVILVGVWTEGSVKDAENS